ncbi:MAG TPA: ABC transporter permease [Blastocatellia bacterium]|nr:ABC transporter permease [Blastocatellia bacterium]
MGAVSRTDTDGLAEPAYDSGQALYHLPEKPLVVIEPHRSWVALNLRDLWAYREVFYFLMWRDIKVRYKQTAFGIAWAIIQPLFLMFVFAFFFGKLVRVASDGAPYPIWVYVGILPWTFFSNALANGGNSLIGNSNLITKVYFPRLLIPSAAIAAGLLDFSIAFALLLAFIPFYGLGLTWGMLMLPPLVLLVTVLALAVGTWTAALNARYRDVRHALPFAIQLWMFATPIIYPLSIVPDEYRWVIALNPLTGIVEGFRAALFGWPFDWAALGFSTAVTILLLVFFVYVFRRMESSFADVI